MSDDGADKKHDPSEKGWRDAAAKGQIPRSSDLASVGVLVAGAAMLTFYGGWVVQPVTESLELAWELGDTRDFNAHRALSLWRASLAHIARGALVPLVGCMVAAVVINVAQTRGQLADKALEPDPNRINPLSNFQNQYMSWTPLVELGKGLMKMAVLLAVTYTALIGHVSVIPTLAVSGPADLLAFMVARAWNVVAAAAPFLLVLAAADFAYAYYRQFEQLKRTDQQVKDEAKESDGDPRTKAQRRSVARKYATRSLIAAVAEADVLVTNPTHYAVALRYQAGQDGAPVVLAKGVDHIALLLRTEALRRGVPRVEDRPLARALYAQVDIGHPIPEAMFMPVARVLAVVMRRKQRKRARSKPGLR